MPLKEKARLRAVCLIVAFTVLVNQTVFAGFPSGSPFLPPSLADKNLDTFASVSDFFIPQGRKIDIQSTITNPSQKLVIFIEDAHGNISAQRNTAQVINLIAKQARLKEPWIALEGTGGGEIDHRVISAFPHMPTRNQVAEKFLHQGKLTGAEYFASALNPKARLFGVDSDELAEANRQKYRDFIPLKPDVDRSLAALLKANRFLKERIYYGDLVRLNKSVEQFEQNSRNLLKHLALLQNLAKRKGISLDQYPHLLSVMPGSSSRAFVTGGAGDEGEAISEQRLLRRPPLKQWRAPRNDVTDKDLFGKLDIAKAFSEIRHLTDELWKKLLYYREARDAYFIDRKIKFYKKLLGFSLLPEDYSEYVKNHQTYSLDSLRKRIKLYHFLLHPKPLRPKKGDFEVLKAASKPALEFYELAHKRDTILTANLEALARENPTPKTFFVSGGFHRHEIVSELRTKQIPFVVLTPKITEPGGEKNYWSLLTRTSTVNLESSFRIPEFRQEFSQALLQTLKAATDLAPRAKERFIRQYYQSLTKTSLRGLGAGRAGDEAEAIPDLEIASSSARKRGGLLAMTSRAEVRTGFATDPVRIALAPGQATSQALDNFRKAFSSEIARKVSLNQELLDFLFQSIESRDERNGSSLLSALTSLGAGMGVRVHISEDYKDPFVFAHDTAKNPVFGVNLKAFEEFRKTGPGLGELFLAVMIFHRGLFKTLARSEGQPREGREEARLFVELLRQLETDPGWSQQELTTKARFAASRLKDSPAIGKFAQELNRQLGFGPGTLLLNRYELLEPIGEGGFGTVYKARDHDMGGADIAVKVGKPSSRKTPEEAEMEKHQHRREVRISIGFKNKRHLVRYTQASSQEIYVGDMKEEVTVVAMDLVEGRSLKKWIPQLTDSQKVHIFNQILEGVREMHEVGVVHRDLKPENILIDRQGEVWVVDYGLAKIFDEEKAREAGIIQDESFSDKNYGGSGPQYDLTVTGTGKGTPLYMSPRQFLGEKAGPDFDLYALGAIGSELFGNVNPFNPPDQKPITTPAMAYQRHADPKWLYPPEEKLKSVETGLAWIFLRAMAHALPGTPAGEIKQKFPPRPPKPNETPIEIPLVRFASIDELRLAFQAWQRIHYGKDESVKQRGVAEYQQHMSGFLPATYGHLLKPQPSAPTPATAPAQISGAPRTPPQTALKTDEPRRISSKYKDRRQKRGPPVVKLLIGAAAVLLIGFIGLFSLHPGEKPLPPSSSSTTITAASIPEPVPPPSTVSTTIPPQIPAILPEPPKPEVKVPEKETPPKVEKGPDPETLALAKEAIQRLKEASGKLPPDPKALEEEFNGLAEEIAKTEAGISKDTQTLLSLYDTLELSLQRVSGKKIVPASAVEKLKDSNTEISQLLLGLSKSFALFEKTSAELRERAAGLKETVALVKSRKGELERLEKNSSGLIKGLAATFSQEELEAKLTALSGFVGQAGEKTDSLKPLEQSIYLKKLDILKRKSQVLLKLIDALFSRLDSKEKEQILPPDGELNVSLKRISDLDKQIGLLQAKLKNPEAPLQDLLELFRQVKEAEAELKDLLSKILSYLKDNDIPTAVDVITGAKRSTWGRMRAGDKPDYNIEKLTFLARGDVNATYYIPQDEPTFKLESVRERRGNVSFLVPTPDSSNFSRVLFPFSFNLSDTSSFELKVLAKINRIPPKKEDMNTNCFFLSLADTSKPKNTFILVNFGFYEQGSGLLVLNLPNKGRQEGNLNIGDEFLDRPLMISLKKEPRAKDIQLFIDNRNVGIVRQVLRDLPKQQRYGLVISYYRVISGGQSPRLFGVELDEMEFLLDVIKIEGVVGFPQAGAASLPAMEEAPVKPQSKIEHPDGLNELLSGVKEGRTIRRSEVRQAASMNRAGYGLVVIPLGRKGGRLLRKMFNPRSELKELVRKQKVGVVFLARGKKELAQTERLKPLQEIYGVRILKSGDGNLATLMGQAAASLGIPRTAIERMVIFGEEDFWGMGGGGANRSRSVTIQPLPHPNPLPPLGGEGEKTKQEGEGGSILAKAEMIPMKVDLERFFNNAGYRRANMQAAALLARLPKDKDVFKNVSFSQLFEFNPDGSVVLRVQQDFEARLLQRRSA